MFLVSNEFIIATIKPLFTVPESLPELSLATFYQLRVQISMDCDSIEFDRFILPIPPRGTVNRNKRSDYVRSFWKIIGMRLGNFQFLYSYATRNEKWYLAIVTSSFERALERNLFFAPINDVFRFSIFLISKGYLWC